MASPGAAAHRGDGCRLCESRSLELVFRLHPTPIGDDYVAAERLGEDQPVYPLDLHLCRDCGHLQLGDAVDPKALFGRYAFRTAGSAGLVEHFRKLADDLLRREGLGRGSLAVDIGSNDGSLLRFFKERGLKVLGVDPALEIAAEASESGIETRPAFFTSELARGIRADRGPASLVTAANVFAHSRDLADMADGVRELLAPEGLFVFEVSYLLDVVEKMLFDTIYHEHLSYHSVRPLQGFLRRHGLELVDVQRIPMKGGSIRGFVRRAPSPAAPSVAGLIALEEAAGLERPETFKAFAGRVGGAGARVREALARLRAGGKSAAGYGASVSSTTLIYHFELGESLRFIADDNPAKLDTYSPGFHIPVLPPRALYDERRPDAVLILAWNYAPAILRKHQSFVETGGRVIVPLPRMQVFP